MSMGAAPDPAELPETPTGTGGQWPEEAADGVPGEDGPHESGYLDEDSVADDQGLRWAALLAAFINDVQPPPATPPAD
ncbi:hypothetical protein ABZ802_17745 [Streptomyces sp. NPDC047737]|jgi:hypothetical protein|uniref:hypothetical protein n=1 Tax=unclassified Streptomyces TaxID=2593676 RepID=UPI0033C5C9CA